MSHSATILSIISFISGLAVGVAFQTHDLQRVAVHNGAAQYNIRTGAFEWISQKKSEPVHDYALDVQMQIEQARQENWKCE